MYDAIVVGARCAGSPTAMLLARKGYRVLLVDKAGFPSDTLSAHYIHQPGSAALKRWGLKGEQHDTALQAVADFAELKSPYTLGHSRAVAELVQAAARNA